MIQDDLNIGVNLLPVLPETGGVETYVRSFVEGVRIADTDARFTAFINKESKGLFNFPPQFQVVNTTVPASIRSARYLWEQTILPYQILKKNVDVLFSPGVMAPIFSTVPSVITIHDANFSEVPETFTWFKKSVISRAYPLSAKAASKVLTVSNFSKSEIVKNLDIPGNKVEVVHNPLPPNLSDPNPNDESEIGSPYLLTVGKDYQHKNLKTAIKALQYHSEQVQHVFAGFDAPQDHPLRLTAKSLGVEDRVHFAGYVSEERLATLYSKSALYVHPSRYEGFGFPLIEAMYYSTPVISSSAASLPEVGGDAALYFDPDSPNELAQAVRRVLESDHLRRELIYMGKHNIGRFTCKSFVEEIVATCNNECRL